MSENLSRRRFLIHLAVLGAVAALPSSEAGAGEVGKWMPVGPSEKFTTGHCVQVTLSDNTIIYITHTANNIFLALSGYCTHKGCVVAWDDKPRQFVCPCHKGRFDETGRNVGGPPPRPLPSYQTRVEPNGVLSVLIS